MVQEPDYIRVGYQSGIAAWIVIREAYLDQGIGRFKNVYWTKGKNP